MLNFLKSLFDGSLFSNNRLGNQGTRKAEGNSGPVFQGDTTYKIGTINIGGPVPQPKITLTSLELQILEILAAGGKARYALGEDGKLEQINIFGHPDQNDIAPNSEETLAAFRTLLKYRLLDDHPAEHLYQCSAEGRNALAAGTVTVSWKR